MAMIERPSNIILFLLSVLLVTITAVQPSKGPIDGGDQVPLTVVKGAVATGAVCLDGSPPAYQFAPGSGAGARNWLVFLQGGGWCLDTSWHGVDNCTKRATTDLGSSRLMEPRNFTQVLSPLSNTSYFYDWNRVLVRYCDGGSFAGNADEPDPVTHLYYRGARIFDAVVGDLMARGLRGARNVLFAGGSAGGLGAIIHCDRFCGLFPKNSSVRVKCLADSSFFIRLKDPSRAGFLDHVFRTVVDMQRLHRALPVGCTSKMGAEACFFPRNLLRYVKSPIFMINSGFDSYHVITMFSMDLNHQIENHTVSQSNMTLLQGLRREMINALPPVKVGNGYLITSVYGHDFADHNGYKIPMFGNTNRSRLVETVVLDWFYDRTPNAYFIDPSDKPFYVPTNN